MIGERIRVRFVVGFKLIAERTRIRGIHLAMPWSALTEEFISGFVVGDAVYNWIPRGLGYLLNVDRSRVRRVTIQ